MNNKYKNINFLNFKYYFDLRCSYISWTIIFYSFHAKNKYYAYFWLFLGIYNVFLSPYHYFNSFDCVFNISIVLRVKRKKISSLNSKFIVFHFYCSNSSLCLGIIGMVLINLGLMIGLIKNQ